ncbi:hypothetical protein AHAS_Ahas03G0077700 [Arachis hypogaea]
MPWRAPIPRHQLAPAEIPVAHRWSHQPWTRKWMARTQANIMHAIDIMEEFVWKTYVGIIIPAEVHAHLDV